MLSFSYYLLLMIILDLPTGGAYMPWHPPIAHSLFYIYKEKTIGLATGLHRLEKSARINQVACNGIEHAVDIATTLRSGIEFGQINVFVDGDADGDVGEGQHLCDGDLHEHDVHIGQT